MVMMLPLLLALYLASFLPGRNWCYLQELHDDSHYWYHSLQGVGERFEDHIKTIYHLLQKLDSWVEEHMRTLDVLVSNHVKTLWEWLEKHTEDLNVWLSMYFWVLKEFHNKYMKDLEYKLGREILFHEKCWGEDLSKAEMWLEHPNVTMYKWMDEASLTFYKAWEMQGYNVENSLQEYAEKHLQHLEEHVKTLEQLLDNYRAAASKWLDRHATSKEVTSQDLGWNLPSMGSWAKTLRRTQIIALQRKCLSVIKWLEEHIVNFEEWLWDTIN